MRAEVAERGRKQERGDIEIDHGLHGLLDRVGFRDLLLLDHLDAGHLLQRGGAGGVGLVVAVVVARSDIDEADDGILGERGAARGMSWRARWRRCLAADGGDANPPTPTKSRLVVNRGQPKLCREIDDFPAKAKQQRSFQHRQARRAGFERSFKTTLELYGRFTSQSSSRCPRVLAAILNSGTCGAGSTGIGNATGRPLLPTMRSTSRST